MADNNNSYKIGLILLAAGASERMGRPKQLLNYSGESLIRRGLKAAAETSFKPVVAVLGSYAELIGAEIQDFPISIVVNQEWQEGMGASISRGMSHMLTLNKDLEGVLVMLCDQPQVDHMYLSQLKAAFSGQCDLIVATAYEKHPGVPAIFGNVYFQELILLNGKEGARNIIAQNLDRTISITPKCCLMDIDTPEDYELLNQE